MQQIADWLEKLGMSEYAQLFAQNRIDFSVLADLTDQHLKDLQLPLGDRLKMLRAIRELSVTTVARPATSAAPVVQVQNSGHRVSQKCPVRPPLSSRDRYLFGAALAR